MSDNEPNLFEQINLDLDKSVEETKDVAAAFLVGAAFGDTKETRAFVANLGGDPEPEQKAFEFGLKVRPMVAKWAIGRLATLIMGKK